MVGPVPPALLLGEFYELVRICTFSVVQNIFKFDKFGFIIFSLSRQLM